MILLPTHSKQRPLIVGTHTKSIVNCKFDACQNNFNFSFLLINFKNFYRMNLQSLFKAQKMRESSLMMRMKKMRMKHVNSSTLRQKREESPQKKMPKTRKK